MFDNSSISNSKNQTDSLIHLNFSSTFRLTRHLVHIFILFVFILLLTYVNRRYNTIRQITRPCSNLSRFLVSIGIIALVLNDLLVINGVSHQFWCSIHHLSLELLLTIIVTGRLLPDFYEYSLDRHDSATSKLSILFCLIIIIFIQLFISIESIWKNSTHSTVQWDPPVLCSTFIRPQLFIFLLHCLEFIFNLQSTNSSRIFQLNSICLRLIYFTGTSVLHIFFWPSPFSATFYASILVIESVLIYQENVLVDENSSYIDNRHRSFLPLKTDDELCDETRLINSMD